MIIAELTIHLGSEWRDLGICILGVIAGTVLGLIIGLDHEAKRTQKRNNP